jgi:hypothetical protein
LHKIRWWIPAQYVEVSWDIYRVSIHSWYQRSGLLVITIVRTLHKIHTFVEAQQNSSKVKKFFRQSEMSTLLKECRLGLQQGLNFFEVSHLIGIAMID